MLKFTPYLILTLLLVGCCFLECGIPPTPPDPSTLLDPHLFEDETCISACWQGLRPGVSTLENLQTTARNLGSQARPVTSVEDDGIDPGEWFVWGMDNPLYPRMGYSVEAFIGSDERLVSLTLRGPFDFTLRDVVSVLGDPEHILAYADRFGPTATAEISIVFYYPEDGFTFITQYWIERYWEMEHPVSLCIEESDLVYRIAVFDPDAAVESDTPVISWPGFTCLQSDPSNPAFFNRIR